jgi:DNA mismatch repair protein MutL
MEVKFENESNIYRFVLAVVRKTLATHDLIPSVSFAEGSAPSEMSQRLRFGVAPTVASPFRGSTTANQRQTGEELIEGAVASSEEVPSLNLELLFTRIEQRMASEQSSNARQPTATPLIIPHEQRYPPEQQERAEESRAIWQVHNKYIVSQIRGGLLIVDQHAAHERILYEKAIANFDKDLPSSQQLLFPQTIQFGTHDYVVMKTLLPYLEKLGFDVKLFGRNTVVVEGIPADVRVGKETTILHDVLEEFKRNEHHGMTDARETLAKSFACKAAIKAGDRLKTTEMISLIDQLFAVSMPYVCPHGRPVLIKLPLEELDRRFGRT